MSGKCFDEISRTWGFVKATPKQHCDMLDLVTKATRTIHFPSCMLTDDERNGDNEETGFEGYKTSDSSQCFPSDSHAQYKQHSNFRWLKPLIELWSDAVVLSYYRAHHYLRRRQGGMVSTNRLHKQNKYCLRCSRNIPVGAIWIRGSPKARLEQPLRQCSRNQRTNGNCGTTWKIWLSQGDRSTFHKPGKRSELFVARIQKLHASPLEVYYCQQPRISI